MSKWLWIGLIVAVAAVFLIVLPQLETKNREKRLDAIYAKTDMTGNQLQQLFDNLPEVSEGAVVFAGNSLTAALPLNTLGKGKFVNHGIPGALVSTMIYQTEGLKDEAPALLFLEGGINDLLTGSTPQQVCASWLALLDKLQKDLPETKIAVQSILPVRPQLISSARVPGINNAVREINAYLYAECMKRNLLYADVYTHLQEDGQLNDNYTTDGVHLNSEGYSIWIEEIKPLLSAITTN
ncbi:MAG: GDSL-type esterase/lipase family protein [Bacteroidia bacterium]